MGTYGSILSPGLSHNAFVAKISNMEIMDLIALHTPYSLIMMGIGLVGITVICFFLKDHKATAEELAAFNGSQNASVERINFLKALAPLVPLVILVLGNTYLPALKMGVAQAMVIGAIYTIIVTLSEPGVGREIWT